MEAFIRDAGWHCRTSKLKFTNILHSQSKTALFTQSLTNTWTASTYFFSGLGMQSDWARSKHVYTRIHVTLDIETSATWQASQKWVFKIFFYSFNWYKVRDKIIRVFDTLSTSKFSKHAEMQHVASLKVVIARESTIAVADLETCSKLTDQDIFCKLNDQ